MLYVLEKAPQGTVCDCEVRHRPLLMITFDRFIHKGNDFLQLPQQVMLGLGVVDLANLSSGVLPIHTWGSCRARKIACPTSRGNKKFQSGNCNFFTYVPVGNHAFIRYLVGPGFSINIFVRKMGKINKWQQGMVKLSAEVICLPLGRGKKRVQGILLRKKLSISFVK